MNPIFATAISDGVNMHRIELPASHIPQSVILPLGFQEFPQGATHIVFNSVFTYTHGKQAEMLKACKDAGMKVVLDVDDHWQVNPDHRNYAAKQKSGYAKDVTYCIKHADLVWCASHPLVEECKKLNPNSHYIPNAHADVLLPPRAQGKRFGYVAYATDHLQDATQLKRAFYLLRKNKLPNVEVGWCGNAGTPECNRMRDIFDKAGSYFMGQYLKGNTYWWHYRNFDTALAPVIPNDWSRYKSALKAIEAGSMGCGFICSDVENYQEFTHGTDCLKCNNTFDWYRNMKKLHKEPQFALDLSYNLQEIVKQKFNPQRWAAERVQLMEAL